MRFAAVSDIHGNLPALEAVIADIRASGVSSVVNLGDSLSGPLWPVETARRLMALGWPTLAGNHERQLLTLSPGAMGRTDAETAAVLTRPIRAWMASLPSSLALSDDVLLCHGTPASDDTYWLHKGRRGAMREAVEAEIAADAANCALTLCGHTHLSGIARLSDGRLIANPGSVGLASHELLPPAEPGRPPGANYLIAERTGGRWAVEIRSAPYDVETSARRAEAANRPTWAHALRTGRVMS